MRFGDRHWTAAEAVERIGRWRQLCGVRAARLLDGPESGVRAVDLYNERLRVTVYPDRGMDVGALVWRGLPLTWESPTGPVHPALVDTTGHGWGKGFHGGLAATCGLENVGQACVDEGLAYGQHGTLSYTPVERVAWRERAVPSGVRGEVEGEVPGPEGLRFTRKVWVQSGTDSVWIEDRVANPGPVPVPWLIQYHMNVGFPLLSEAAEVLVPGLDPVPRDAASAAGLANWNRVEAPQPGYGEQVFRHAQAPDRRGFARCAILNDELGLGLVLRYPVGPLPHLWQWRVFAPQRYVLALEPSNCLVKPRSRARAEGVLPMLAPFASVQMRLQVRIVEGDRQLATLRKELRAN